MTNASIAKAIIKCIKSGGFVFVVGNGGSAAMASHFAGEMIGKYRKVRKALPVMALTNDMVSITAVSNDYGYKHVFTRQLEAFSKPGDLLVVLSTSGKSKNCLQAIKWANKHNVRVLDWPRRGNTTPIIQERQLSSIHSVSCLVENAFV